MYICIYIYLYVLMHVFMCKTKDKKKKQWLLEEMFESRVPQAGGREEG